MIVVNNLSGLSEVYLGDESVSEVYVGDNRVWLKDDGGGMSYKVSGIMNGVTYKIECNSDANLLSGETQAYKTNTTVISIGDCVSIIGGRAFRDFKQMTSVTMSDSVTAINAEAFDTCTALNSIVLSNNLTTFHAYAFYACSSLKNIVVPSSVTYIGQSCFENCTALEGITMLSTTPPSLIGSQVFTNTNNCPIYVPSQSVNAYKTATNWRTYTSRIQPIP